MFLGQCSKVIGLQHLDAAAVTLGGLDFGEIVRGTMPIADLRLSDYDAMGAYAEQALLLAEGANDHAALANALLRIVTRYSGIRAPVAAKLTYEAAAEVAREHDLLDPLCNSLLNLAALLNSRDLPGAINYAREAEEVARRSGSHRASPARPAATNARGRKHTA